MNMYKGLTKRRIILASASPRRARLLRQLGLRFIVYPVSVREKRIFKNGCAYLVKANALRKAKKAAKKFRQGIIIGADTVVLIKNKVIGKPKDYNEAKKLLKLFTRYPHWVYTGVAVLDAESGRYLTDYEKTKIIFHKLTDAEISKYLSRNMRLDRAGGIDIEGKSKKLVREIKGDFYNVVGLPVKKIKSLLRQVIMQEDL